jgi:carboxymethylenebutenolidase
VCFEPTARPPAAPRTGLLGGTERLTMTGADGNVFAATLAGSTSPTAPGVVLLPDVRGLHPYYEALAEAFAGAGVHALAVDLYGRTAGAEHRGDAFDFAEHRAAATDAGIRSDVHAAAAELRRRGAGAVYVLGFCFGGRAAFMQGTEEGIAGVIGFYGWPARVEAGGSSPIEEARAGRLKAPVLALYGGADDKIPSADIEAFYGALTEAHVLEETVVYEGAPHSFFDRAMTEHAEACDDAWHRVLRFMGVPAPAARAL